MPEGPFAGRHGEIETAESMVWRPIFGGATSEPSYHYTVRTDAGSIIHPTGALEAETGERPAFVPDPRYQGHAIDPEALQRSIDHDRSSVRKSEASGARARSPTSKAAWREAAATARRNAADKQAVLDQWAAEHPEEAARVLPRQAAAPVEEAAPAPTAAGMSLVETTHTKTGAPLFVVTGGPRVERAAYEAMLAQAKQNGGWWSSFRGHGAVPGWTFKTRDGAQAFMRGLGEEVGQVEAGVGQVAAEERAPPTLPEVTEQAGQAPTPKSFWTYQAETPPEPPPHMTREQWEALSPGMRREIYRSQPELWSPEARTIADAVAPAEGKGPLPVTTEPERAPVERPTPAEPVARGPEPPPSVAPEEPKAPEWGAKNTLFTQDKAEAARAILRAKRGELRTGIDPEMMRAGIDLAGFHLEAGARAFADFSKAMLADIGEEFRPYLRTWYEAIRHYPGFDARGMSDYAEIDAELARARAEEPRPTPPRENAAERADIDRLLDAGKNDPILNEIARLTSEGRTPEEIAEEGPGDRYSQDEIEGIVRAMERRGEIPEPEEAENGLQGALRFGDEGAGSENVQGTAPIGENGAAPPGEVGGGPRNAPATTGERAEERARERVGVGPAEGGGGGPGSTDRVSAAEEGSEPGATGRFADRPDATVKGENFRIEPGDVAEGRGRITKARDNVSAIELAKRLIEDGRPATKAEQAILAKYVGWGGLKGAFPDSAGEFGKGLEAVGARLRELLTPEEYATAERSTQYAHYTAEHVIRSMWDAVRRLGFEGGTVFEPGMGIGHFLGMMPGDLAAKSAYEGIEMDKLTGAIAKLLYPESGVRVADYTRTPMPEGVFDLVIGNPPFSDTTIHSDPKYRQGFMLHDYFFAKSLDSVRPGGLLGFITSAGTMNKLDAAAREYMAERAEFVGGIRLPSSAFARNAGTEVTTDILFFKRRPEGRIELGEEKPAWTQTVARELPNAEGATTEGNVSRYFSENRENVLGQEGFFDKLYKDRYAVHQEPGTDLEADLREAVQRLPENVMDAAPTPEERATLDFQSGQRKDGSFYLDEDGDLMQYRDGAGRPVPRRGKGGGGFTAAERERIEHLVPMRDALRDVFAADLAEDTERGAEARARLNEHYDRFVEKFGPVNKAEITYRRPTIVQQETARLEAREEARFVGDYFDDGDFDPSSMLSNKAKISDIAKARQAARERAAAAGEKFNEGTFDPAEMEDQVSIKRPNIKPFTSDPESYRIRSIENYDDATGKSSKKDIFYRSVLKRDIEPEIKSANDGVLWSMNKFGRFDVDKIAEKMGRDRADVIGELGDAVYKVPGTADVYQTRDEYLSGDVVSKLEEARAAAETDPDVRRNIPALEAAVPPPLPPSEISMFIGMPWIPAATVSEFVREKMELGSPRISHSKATGTWSVEKPNRYGSQEAGAEKWGTPDRSAHELLSDAMNRTPPRIYRDEGEGREKRRVFDEVATQAAQDKVNEIKQAFSDWLAGDQERQDGLAQLYNDQLNRSVLRQYDGSYLTTPGIADTFKWRPHQQRVVARIIQDGNTYMAHAVGAGKTSAMIGAGMEMRRLGLVKKPLYVVPNHMLGQFTKEFYEQYPTARIAVADEEQFHTGRRRQFVANVAQDDHDAVIITHSSFGKIPISDEFQAHLIEEQIDMLDEAIRQMDPESERIAVRRIQKQKEALEQKLSKGSGVEKDQTVTFEEMGIDHLFVDEAHLFRKLSFGTKQASMKGISPEGSGMAWDLYTKVRYLESKNPGRSAVFASGTPITNTMGELYSLSRFMQPDALAKRGLSHFDSWAQTFGDTKTGLEETAAGTYQPVTRFGSFVNLPELYKMVGEVMDIVTPKQLEQYVVRPKLKGGERQMHLAPRTEILDAYQKTLADRMEAIKARRGPPKPGDDILLSVINDGRHAAIDPRYIEQAQNDPHSKLNMMIQNAIDIYHRTADTQFYDPKDGYKTPLERGPATQMIFANMGVNGRGPAGFSGYQWMKEAFRRAGIPSDHVAFIGDYEGTLRRQALFNDMNEGKVRILVGSTQKMGTGVNAQRRLIALHNEDPLWYPADDEQRVGRALRQGNLNSEIEIHDYSTKGTYDSAMWRMMGNKARFIEQFFRGDPNLRSMDDIGEASMYEQASAIATTDERIMTLTQMKQDLELARRRESAHDREQYALRTKLKQKQWDAGYQEGLARDLQSDIERRQETRGEAFKMNIVGEDFTKRPEAAEALDAAIADRGAGLGKGGETRIGSIGGFPLRMRRTLFDQLTYKLETTGGRTVDLNGDTGKGIIASAENKIASLEDALRYAQQRRAQAAKDAETIQPLLGKTFEGTGDILRLAKSVRDLEAQIGGKKLEDAEVPPEPTTPFSPQQFRGEPALQAGFPGEEGRTLYQRVRGKLVLGKIDIGVGGARSVITLMKQANASTFLHETAHAWLGELLSDARDEHAPTDLVADAATVRRWLRAEPDALITKRQHEKFARGFERYMMEGVAPSRGLAHVFAQFKSWLTAIYQTVRRLRAPINDDIRRVFDRLVAAPEGARAVIAPDEAPEAPRVVPPPEVGAKVASDLADLHEADATHTPAAEAEPVADQVAAERERTTVTHAPEVSDELAGRRPGEETGEGGERAPRAPRNGGGGRPAGGEEGNAPALGEERGGGGEATPQSARPRRGKPEQPSSPYESTEQPSDLVDKAGNIRLDNLNADEDVKEVLRELAKQNDDFMVASGGVIPDVQRHAMADALGLTVDNFNPQKPDGVSPSVWATAVQKLTFQTSEEAARLGRIFGESGSPQDAAAYLAAKQRLLLVADHFSTLTAESGRTQRVFNKANMSFTGDLIATMERDTGLTLYQLQEEAKAVGVMDSTAKRSKMMQDTRNLTRWQLIKRGIISYFINNLISGPITHAAYSVGAEIFAIFKATALTAAEATFDAARVAWGGDVHDRVYFGEVGAQIYGMLHGTRDGIVPGWTAFKAGISHMEGAEKLAALAEAGGKGGRGLLAGMSPMGEAALRAEAIGPAIQALKIPWLSREGVAGPIGHVLETPSRVIAGIHTVFYSMNYEREIARRAFRQAANEGLTGSDFSTRVAQLTQDPPAEMIQAAHDEALETVLMRRAPYGTRQSKLQEVVNSSLPLKIIMPFMQIGVNILNEGVIKTTPIGVIASQTVRDNLAGRNGEVARSQQYARIMVGSGIALAVAGAANQGIITGGGPSNWRERALKEATGWKAYSIRIGDTYIPYRKYLGPLGTLVGAMANTYDVAHLAAQGEVDKAVGAAVMGFSEVVADETWMAGIANFVDAMRHWDVQGGKYMKNLALDFVPFSVGGQQVARLVDPYQREVHSWTDALRNKLPGLSQGLYPQRDWTGEPIVSHQMISPSAAKNDRTMAQMEAVEFFPAHLQRQILGVPLTDKQYDDYARISGHLAKMRLDALVNTPGFKDQPAGMQQKAMGEMLSSSRKAGADWVMMQPGNSNILRQAMAAKEAQMQGKTQQQVRGVRREPAMVQP